MQISNEMVEAFGNAFWSVNAASKIDGQREHIRSALEAALSTDAEPVKTAPAVAVKALADAYQKYLDASALYNERLAIAKTKAPGTMRVDEERKAIDDARRAFDKLAVEVATTSVSAQVQDVSGLELRPHEPTEEMLAAAIKADQDGMPASMKTIWMVMWAAYSASPASKHGDAE